LTALLLVAALTVVACGDSKEDSSTNQTAAGTAAS
jgi:hypothetical protein